MHVFKPSKFVRTKNVGSGKMLPLKAIPVKTHKILQLEDDLGCLVFYIVIYSMPIPQWDLHLASRIKVRLAILSTSKKVIDLGYQLHLQLIDPPIAGLQN